MPDDLRDAVAAAIANTVCEHVDTGAACSCCRANAVLAELLKDPGNLPARMAEAMRAHFLSEKSDSWSDGLSDGLTYCVCGETVASWNLHRAQAALSVRWEHAAHLAARVGDAERRAEHAESEHQVTQERLAEAQQHDAQCKRVWDQYPQAIDRLRQLRAYARWCTAHSVEPEERDILELADGTHRDDYVALMAEADRTDGGE